MLKSIIIIIVLTIMYILLASLMKAASKDTPVMPDKKDEDKDK
jgi:hypothetical protein